MIVSYRHIIMHILNNCVIEFLVSLCTAGAAVMPFWQLSSFDRVNGRLF